MRLPLLLLLVGVGLLIPTAYAGKIGAPYAPTRLPAVRRAFEVIGLTSADTLVDLGAGDGSILIEAKKRGARAVGYELSPIMWAIAWGRFFFSSLRDKKRGGEVKIKNFYRQTLPADTTVIFAFLMPGNMNRVKEFLVGQKLPRAKFVLAYAFPFPALEPLHVVHVKNCARLYVYEYQKLI